MGGSNREQKRERERRKEGGIQAEKKWKKDAHVHKIILHFQSSQLPLWDKHCWKGKDPKR